MKMEDKLHQTLQKAQMLQDRLNDYTKKIDSKEWEALFNDTFDLFLLDQKNTLLYQWLARSIVFATLEQKLLFCNTVMPLIELSSENENLWSIVYAIIHQIPNEKLSLLKVPEHNLKYLNPHCTRTLRHIKEYAR